MHGGIIHRATLLVWGVQNIDTFGFDRHIEVGNNANEIIEKMIDGRMNKFFQENVLIEQSFVKNPDIAISDLLTETIAKLGENISIARFTRFQLGETAAKSESPDSE